MALSAHVSAQLSALASPTIHAPSKSVRASGSCASKRVACASAVPRKQQQQQQQPAEPVVMASPLAAVGKAAATAAVASSCAALLMMPLHGLFPADAVAAEAAKAVAVLSGSAGVEGVVAIAQDKDGPSTLTVKITGLTPGKHGFHLHKFGDTTKGCISTGPHFNPAGLSHGGPDDSVRHAGDLGNIVANADGVAETTISDSQIALSGPNSALGRAFVVHELEDDLGKGGAELSLTTGNAGGRLACGVVALAAN